MITHEWEPEVKKLFEKVNNHKRNLTMTHLPKQLTKVEYYCSYLHKESNIAFNSKIVYDKSKIIELNNQLIRYGHKAVQMMKRTTIEETIHFNKDEKGKEYETEITSGASIYYT